MFSKHIRKKHFPKRIKQLVNGLCHKTKMKDNTKKTKYFFKFGTFLIKKKESAFLSTYN